MSSTRRMERKYRAGTWILWGITYPWVYSHLDENLECFLSGILKVPIPHILKPGQGLTPILTPHLTVRVGHNYVVERFRQKSRSTQYPPSPAQVRILCMTMTSAYASMGLTGPGPIYRSEKHVPNPYSHQKTLNAAIHKTNTSLNL